MNRRMQKKLDKRIKKKIMGDVPLTEFEQKYYSKQLADSLNRRKQKLKIKIMTGQRFSIIDAMCEEAIQALNSEKPKEKFFEQRFELVDEPKEVKWDIPVDNNVIPSKWEKLRGKARGWFSK